MKKSTSEIVRVAIRCNSKYEAQGPVNITGCDECDDVVGSPGTGKGVGCTEGFQGYGALAVVDAAHIPDDLAPGLCLAVLPQDRHNTGSHQTRNGN